MGFILRGQSARAALLNVGKLHKTYIGVDLAAAFAPMLEAARLQ
jgi:hypothetical protein